jgi:flavin reductase (DIM6/NTAB) family NADH-FMN oxidoreductase RutF
MKTSLGAKTLAFPTPAWAVGTYDQSGKANAAAVAWGSICCSKPPCLAVSLRAATHTHGSIMHSKAFTVSVPAQTQAALLDYFGIASGKDVDKFAKTGLTAVKSELVNAPYIAEFPLVIECALLNVVEIGLHTQFIGEIKDVKADPACLGADGKLDAAKIGAVIYCPESRLYYGLGELLGQAFSLGRSLAC